MRRLAKTNGMKRIGNLYPLFCSHANLLAAYRQARRGTRKNPETLAFFFHAEGELLQLRHELITGTWQPLPYRYFDIFDPKHRTISVAAFRDRVVHHALVNVLEPVFEARFIDDSFATRKGKGVHAAVLRAQHFMRQNQWFYKSDVEKYFDSVHHMRLLNLLQHKIKDGRFLGRRIFPGTIRLHPSHLRRITQRLKRREKAFEADELEEAEFLQSAQSYWAMLHNYPMRGLHRGIVAKSDL
ncbi:MAG: reverse transcriptase domain-containing protein [Saprospiraceae bacterium]